jgi:hypothetical protein
MGKTRNWYKISQDKPLSKYKIATQGDWEEEDKINIDLKKHGKEL